jgi:glycerophosphoryl diester phosphodiesterase
MPLPLFELIDNWRAPPPSAGKVGWLGGHVYAHRGLHGGGVPENSPTAFAAAVEHGFGIECDVQKSSDGQPMVFHDWELDRLTGESGALARYSAGALGGISLTGSSDRIPTLRRVLDLVAGQVPILIEVKSRRDMHISGFCKSIRRVLEGYLGPHAVMSFDPRVSRWFADHSPHSVRGLVVTEGEDRTLQGQIRRRFSLWHARPDFLACDIRDLPSRFAGAQRRRGLPVLTWTVRSPADRATARAHADAPIAEGAGLDVMP